MEESENRVFDIDQKRRRKKENIWRRKIFGPWRKRRTEKGKEESFGEGKLIVTPTIRQPGEYKAICLFDVRN